MSSSQSDGHVFDAPLRNRGLLYQLSHNPVLIFASFFLSLCFWTFGYDGAVIGGALALPAFNAQMEPKTGALTSNDISLITAVPNTSIVVGLPLAILLADRLGRRKTLIITCAISAIGGAIQTAGINIACMVVGRWVASAAIFMFIVMASTLLSEVAPVEVRGILVGLSIVLIDAAAVLASGLNWAFSAQTGNKTWRVPLSLQITFPMLVAIGLLFIDDSPTSYLIKSKDTAALQSLRRYCKGYSDDEINAEFIALQQQESLRAEQVKVSTLDLFRGTNRRRTLLEMAIPNFQQLSGIALATNYSTVFLKQAVPGSNPFLLALGLTILAPGGAVVGLFLVDYVGRRTLALTIFIIVTIIDLLVGILGFYGDVAAARTATAGLYLCFGFFFAAGFGPLTYISSAEIPTARLKNKTSSFVFFTLACFATVAQYVLPYLIQPDAANLGAKVYLIFAGWMLGVTILTYLYFPETKGRSPAEIDEMFEAKLPARKFKGYVCRTANENFFDTETKDVTELKNLAASSHVEIAA